MIKSVKKEIKQRVQTLTMDQFIMALCISMLKISNKIPFFENLQTSIRLNDINILLSEFLVGYIIINVLAIIYAEYYCKKWTRLEQLVPEAQKIYREFERMFIKRNQLDKTQLKEYNSTKEIIAYFILRQEFLAPTFTPIIKESCLRSDFNFANYLTKCLYRTLEKTFEFSISSLLAFFCFIGFYIMMRILVPYEYEAQLEILIMGSQSLFLMILQLCIKIKVQTVYNQLCFPLKTPYEFVIKQFDSVRNPNVDKEVVPKYLRDGLKNAWVKKNRIANSHEALFWFSSNKFLVNKFH